MELEEPEDARIMLSRAVECCPTSVEVSSGPGLSWALSSHGQRGEGTGGGRSQLPWPAMLPTGALGSVQSPPSTLEPLRVCRWDLRRQWGSNRCCIFPPAQREAGSLPQTSLFSIEHSGP